MATAQWYLEQMAETARDAQHAHLVIRDGNLVQHIIKADDPALHRFHDICHPGAILDLLEDLKELQKKLDERGPS